ncbi:MAG: site-specific DNA-methyltransferase [Bacteroidetes bacterium]|nr:site-specific DNA-methyltransferase [Bacteroidota bacterium]MCW5896432.1 site-specific DNA-methyltransferase [Bacteroidota bacterium]
MNELVEIFPTERQKLYERFADKLQTASHLNRQLVSFQANKEEPIYRWFKYKEGFSSGLVKYFLNKYSDKPGRLLDPFAGVGTTLFAGQSLGWDSYGIEVLPVGVFVMQTREALPKINPLNLSESIQTFWSEFDRIENSKTLFNHISITRDAFPDDTEVALNRFLTYCESLHNKDIKTLLRFAAFSLLEEISYTRKDGQYLRWDYRSKRDLAGKPFNKGRILTFEQALRLKLSHIVADLGPQNDSLFDTPSDNGHDKRPINIIEGSCLAKLPTLDNDSFDFIVTSPPYCNRYDYTRTYALELVFLGCDSDKVRNLRQELLSCTVENKEKLEQLRQLYTSFGKSESFDSVLRVYDSSLAMTEVNAILAELNKLEKLNNNNIPRMVRNYFLEMCFVVSEMARVTKSGGYCVMVNDNVRYGGEEIPVDLILSEFAEGFGFIVRNIFVLPRGKGNSSQQMGNYGRTEIRKCVYLWQKR